MVKIEPWRSGIVEERLIDAALPVQRIAMNRSMAQKGWQLHLALIVIPPSHYPDRLLVAQAAGRRTRHL
jgi:hypothetical protein